MRWKGRWKPGWKGRSGSWVSQCLAAILTPHSKGGAKRLARPASACPTRPFTAQRSLGAVVTMVPTEVRAGKRAGSARTELRAVHAARRPRRFFFGPPPRAQSLAPPDRGP